jgi:hypothetical protein
MGMVLQIAQLQELLPKCLLADQVALGSRLLRGLTLRREGRPVELPLDRWLERARASIEARQVLERLVERSFRQASGVAPLLERNRKGTVALPTVVVADFVRQRHGVEIPLSEWAIEEFKVSTYAQELGTSAPVSAKRLEAALAGLRERLPVGAGQPSSNG